MVGQDMHLRICQFGSLSALGKLVFWQLDLLPILPMNPCRIGRYLLVILSHLLHSIQHQISGKKTSSAANSSWHAAIVLALTGTPPSLNVFLAFLRPSVCSSAKHKNVMVTGISNSQHIQHVEIFNVKDNILTASLPMYSGCSLTWWNFGLLLNTGQCLEGVVLAASRLTMIFRFWFSLGFTIHSFHFQKIRRVGLFITSFFISIEHDKPRFMIKKSSSFAPSYGYSTNAVIFKQYLIAYGIHISYLFVSSSLPSELSSSSLENLLRVGFLFLRGTLLWPGLFEGGGGEPFKSLSLSDESEFHDALKYMERVIKIITLKVPLLSLSFESHSVNVKNIHICGKISKIMAKMAHITDVPEEILFMIVKLLDLPDQQNLYNTSQYFRYLLSNCGISQCTFKRLKRLKTLDISYTNLNIPDLLEIVKVCPSLKDVTVNFVFGRSPIIRIDEKTLTEYQDLFSHFENVHFVGSLTNLLLSRTVAYMLEKAKLDTIKLSAVEFDHMNTSLVERFTPCVGPSFNHLALFLVDWRAKRTYDFLRNFPVIAALDLKDYEFFVISTVHIHDVSEPSQAICPPNYDWIFTEPTPCLIDMGEPSSKEGKRRKTLVPTVVLDFDHNFYNLATLSVECPNLASRGYYHAICRAIKTSKSLKNLRIVDKGMDFKTIFDSLILCPGINFTNDKDNMPRTALPPQAYVKTALVISNEKKNEDMYRTRGTLATSSEPALGLKTRRSSKNNGFNLKNIWNRRKDTIPMPEMISDTP
ncbi:hypothetical protein HW555_002458 [Spodoptera exigua]|uniref:F-box domain-containing protein n=1 Tax=Spodoptera exigua TaxID=7107 RepID=A0A835GQM6_SPOEX|nr:hypothetical protein HW555_002458 [Spodoptera exigua]